MKIPKVVSNFRGSHQMSGVFYMLSTSYYMNQKPRPNLKVISLPPFRLISKLSPL